MKLLPTDTSYTIDKNKQKILSVLKLMVFAKILRPPLDKMHLILKKWAHIIKRRDIYVFDKKFKVPIS